MSEIGVICPNCFKLKVKCVCEAIELGTTDFPGLEEWQDLFDWLPTSGSTPKKIKSAVILHDELVKVLKSLKTGLDKDQDSKLSARVDSLLIKANTP